MAGHLTTDGLPALGAVMDCGCVVRLLSVASCPRCGEPPLGGGLVRFPVSALPGTVTTLEVGCWCCGIEFSARARVLA